MSSGRVATDIERLGRFFQRQAVGQLNRQRSFGRCQLEQLLSQLHGWVGLAAGVAHKDGDASGRCLPSVHSSGEMLCTTTPQFS